MFFRLFKEYEQSHGEMQTILLKQIYYITNPTPSIRLHQYLQQQLQKTKGLRMDQGSYIIEYGRNSSARLRIFERNLSLEANGSFEAETHFFELLRKYEGTYLAIDIENERCGWLKPIKERKFV